MSPTATMWFKTPETWVPTFSRGTGKNKTSLYFPFLNTQTALVLGGLASEIPLGQEERGKATGRSHNSRAQQIMRWGYIYLENHNASLRGVKKNKQTCNQKATGRATPAWVIKKAPCSRTYRFQRYNLCPLKPGSNHCPGIM